jgi:tetratricopeptide (TPR) repeat protein
MRINPLLGFALAAWLAAGPAGATVTVIGSTFATDCWRAADTGRTDDDALEVCDIALQQGGLDPRDEAGTRINRGVIELGRHDYDHARADFDHAIASLPKQGEGWANRGAVDVAQSRYQDAVADIDKALALGVDQPAKSWFNRAIADEAMDDEKSAYIDYSKAATLAPKWDLPRQELLRFTVTQR